ncbi:putative paraoxonase [Thozetella sp. PMI_491]|nr:putative paraoxonase [Thozetella sp. PMI_491]
MVVKTSLAVAVLAALALYLYDRLPVGAFAYFNAPGRMPQHANFKSSEVKFADQIRSCEDVILVESRGVALLACDPGRETWNTVMGIFGATPDPNAELYIYKYADPALPDAQSLLRLEIVGFDAELRTLGLELDEATSTLFVTNHQRQGPGVEVFKLDFDALTATYIRSIVHPLVHAPNSVAVIDSRSFLVTNQHYFVVADYPLLSQIETYTAPPIGTVVHVRILSNGTVDAEVVARLPYPNGIVLFNETTVAVSSSNNAAVYFYAYTPAASLESPADSSAPRQSHPTLKYRSSIRVPFHPDNLSVSRDGTLFIAGHPHLRTLGQFTRSRQICNRPEVLAKPEHADMREHGCKALSAPSWVSEWSEAQGLRHIYSGYEYPSSATAARDVDKNVGIVAGLYAKGIMVWRE